MTEISLAGKQAVAKIKSEIASLIIAKAYGPGREGRPSWTRRSSRRCSSPWPKTGTEPTRARSNCRPCCPKASARSSTRRSEERAKELLAAGVEVGWSKEVKTGFKVGAKEGGYYISFADADIEALLAEYLRDKVFQLLFKA